MNKLVFANVEMPYTILCAYSQTLEVHKLELSSMDMH